MLADSIDVDAVWTVADELPEQIELSDWFSSDNPRELEVGSGKGMFLLRESQRRPDVDFVGVEWSKKYARVAAERLAKRGRSNVRLVSADVRELITRFADASFEAVHVYFPDPWWKQRHKKRRVMNPDFVGQIARVLRGRGVLSLATDVEEYFGVMQKVLSKFDQFVELPPPDPREPVDDLDYLTHFERKYRREGRPIHRAAYRRQ